MIQHNETKENPNYELNVSFIAAIKELDISGILSRCGIRKDSRKLKGESSDEKRTAFEIFQFLLLMVFQGCNLYRYLGSKKQDIACSKSTYHRFLGNEHYNWRRFITLLAAKVTMYFDTLTDRNRFKALVLDDSVIERSRSKAVELLAFVFDHVIGKSVRDSTCLRSDGRTALVLSPLRSTCFHQQNRKNASRGLTPKLTSVRMATKPGYPQPCISRMQPSQ